MVVGMDTNRWLLLSIHSLNATVWLLIGVVLVVIGDDGTPAETSVETIGGFLIFAVLLVKLLLFIASISALTKRPSTPA